MLKNKVIFLTVFFTLFFINLYCQNNNKDKQKVLNSIYSKTTEPNADSILSIFKQFWPILDSLENELLKAQKAEIKYPKEEHEVDMSLRYYLDTINYTIREEGEANGVSELRTIFYNNAIKVISSSFNGTRSFTNQTDIGVYNYNSKTKEFLIDSIDTKLFQVQLKDYFKKDAPDSVIKYTSTYTSYFFHIVYNEKGVAVNRLFSNFFDGKFEDTKWLIGNVIIFDFKDNKFTRSEPYFSED